MQIRLIALAALLAAPAAFAAPPAPEMDVVAYGLYGAATRIGGVDPALPQHSLSGVDKVSVPHLLRRTDRIEAHACTQFGLQFRVRDLPPDGPRSITVQVTHPRLHRPDGQSAITDRYTIPLDRNVLYTGYVFDEPWGLVPGVWTFTLLYQGQALGGKSFTVDVAPGVRVAPGTTCVPVES